MFEDRVTRNGVKIILPPLEQRPVTHQVKKRPRLIPTPRRPRTVPVPLTPLERLKSLRKLRRMLCCKNYNDVVEPLEMTPEYKFIEYVFTDPNDKNRKLSYAEMRSRYG